MDDLELATLAVINGIRSAFGAPKMTALPQGVPGSARECVIARAVAPLGIETHVGRQSMTIKTAMPVDEDLLREWVCVVPVDSRAGVTRYSILFPDAVTEFTNRFDLGAYPQYIRGTVLTEDQVTAEAEIAAAQEFARAYVDAHAPAQRLTARKPRSKITTRPIPLPAFLRH